MTIGQTQLENYNQASQFLIDKIDAAFDTYTNYITYQLVNYVPKCEFDTGKYLVSIDIENLLNLQYIDDNGGMSIAVNFIHSSLKEEYPPYEWVINNYKARLHLATKLDNWLKEFSANENISYTMGSGRITFNLIKEQKND
jgi:hypothetical protein